MKQKDSMDQNYLRQCIILAAQGSKSADFPFGSLLVYEDAIISKRFNEARDKNEVYRHAEMLVLIDAQKRLSPQQLKKSTLYSSIEPCAMCSFAIQELGIARVVFGLRSPIMGGFSKWKILQDEELGRIFPNTFGKAPKIVPDVLRDEVAEGWRNWNSEKWRHFVEKGVFKP